MIRGAASICLYKILHLPDLIVCCGAEVKVSFCDAVALFRRSSAACHHHRSALDMSFSTECGSSHEADGAGVRHEGNITFCLHDLRLCRILCNGGWWLNDGQRRLMIWLTRLPLWFFSFLFFSFNGHGGYRADEAGLEIVLECNISIISRSAMVCACGASDLFVLNHLSSSLRLFQTSVTSVTTISLVCLSISA